MNLNLREMLAIIGCVLSVTEMIMSISLGGNMALNGDLLGYVFLAAGIGMAFPYAWFMEYL